MADLVGTSSRERFNADGIYVWNGSSWVIRSSSGTTADADTVTAGGENDEAYGGAGNDTLQGEAGNDKLYGEEGDDLLDGGSGNDTMVGGIGNDTYVVGSSSDIVDESNADGVDTVRSTISFSLVASPRVKGDIENLTLEGSGNINGTGNALANVITGNGGNNVLAGLGGADRLIGGAGTDTASYAASAAGVTVSLFAGTGMGGDAEGDTLEGIENLTGSGKNDVLEGDLGGNVIDGGSGTDMVSYAHATSGVEVSLAVTAVAQDTKGAGSDRLISIENLTGSGHNDRLTGSSGNNVLIGGEGDDLLDGGSGNDTMVGGFGSDTYVVGSSSDIVDESNADGVDTVRSTISFSLVASPRVKGDIENLTLEGSGNINGTGNALANVITGNGGKNVLSGGGGNDRLTGSGGADTLDGGAGGDTFAYRAVSDSATASGNFDSTTGDTILSFTSSAEAAAGLADRIDLSELTAAIDHNLLWTGTTASAYGVWQSRSGSATLVNVDTSGDGVADMVAKINTSETLSAQDFVGVDTPAVVIALDDLDANEGFSVTGANTGGFAGWTVSAAGDVNGDGLDDFIVGAPYGSTDGSNVGEAYVIFGTGSPLDIDLTDPSELDGFVVRGLGNDDLTSRGVSALGDVNGDGFDDLIIGAPYGDAGATNAGQAYVILGGSGLGDLDASALPPDRGFSILGGDTDGLAGWSVSSAGDVNGDGLDDILIGAPYGGGAESAGSAYVIFGTLEPETVDLAALQPGQGIVVRGDSAGDIAGWSVASAGDVNGDGFDDLIIGAPYAGGGDYSGRAYVVFGSPSLSDIDLGDLSSASGFEIQGGAPNDFAGWSVAGAGDVNGDGFDDVIVGTPYGSEGGDYAGQAYVIFGSAAAETIDLGDLEAGQGILIQGDAPGDLTGWSVASAGDVNGDGFDDLIIGAPYGSEGGGYAGQAYLIFGGKALSDIDLKSLGSSQGLVIAGGVEGDYAGMSVSAAGDINGDGFGDLLVGAPTANATTGEAYVILGGAFGPSDTSVVTSGTTAKEIILGGVGDDVLTGGGPGDVLRGGAGDDLLAVTDAGFAHADGGSGYDRLRLDVAGQNFDFTGLLAARVESIEAIDMTGNGNNSITLSALDIMAISDDRRDGLTYLTVTGDNGDVLSLTDGEWTASDVQAIDSDGFDVFANGNAVLLVHQDVDVSGLPFV